MLLWIVAAIALLFGFVVFFGAPYVPSHRSQVERSLGELYPISSEDVLIDIGSGDGLVLRVAARRGARGIGYEINPALVLISYIACRRWRARIHINLANFWTVSMPDSVTVFYVFMVERDALRMYKKLQQEVNRIGHPVALISYGATVPGIPVTKKVGAHILYTLHPLQQEIT